MYRALYRKYRPTRFAEVCGQEHVTATLVNQLKNGTVSHAYLFTGSRGTGKTSCAKILAKAVNCLSPENGDACCRCEACLLAEAEENLDITEIDAASNNSVNDIRELRANVNFAPASSKYRVYIIDEVHMLSSGAFNALLKTIEEPPAHAIFILATTEVHKLPATVVSRCQRYDFHRIAPEVIAARLKFVAESEGFGLTDGAAELISELCDGGMRDALSMLDLCAAYSESVDEAVVHSACAVAGRERLFELCDGIASEDTGAVLSVTDGLRRDGIDMQRLCSDLISHFRDLLIVKTVKNTKGLVVCTASELEKYRAQSARFTPSALMLAVRVLGDALNRMTSSNRRAELETALIKLCSPELCDDREALAARLERLEYKLNYLSASPATIAPLPTPTEPAPADREQEAVPAPLTVESEDTPSLELSDSDAPPVEPEKTAPARAKPSAPLGAGDSAAEERPFPEWSKVLKLLSASCPLLIGYLGGSKAYIRGDFLLIDCKNEQFLKLMGHNLYKDHIRNAAHEITGRQFKLGPYKADGNDSKSDLLGVITGRLRENGVPGKG